MPIQKFLLTYLFFLSSVALAITRQDLEQMKSELDNPITLEMVETVLFESGLPFMKAKGQNSCTYYYSHSEPHVKTFKIVVDFHSYAGKEILHRIDWGSDYAYYEIVDGRFQLNEYYYRHSKSSDSVIESRTQLMDSFNSILDKIENGKSLYWPHSGRCENCAIQMMSSYLLSEQLGSRGVCSGGRYNSERQTCNYRVVLDDDSIADVSIEYMKSNRGNDYTPVFFEFNDNLKTEKDDESQLPVTTIKIGKQEWMDHNLLYGEGLTEKYSVDVVVNRDLSNIRDIDYDSKSIALPSGEQNGWLVFMDLNLRQSGTFDFIEKPDIKENHQGLCPTGFHVPTRAEWKELFSFVAKDKVRFLKYDLFEEYNVVLNEYEKQTGYGWGGSSDKSRKLRKKLESIENELDAAYNKWRKGKKDGFYCENGEKCRFNKYDMRNVIEGEVIRHLCSKEAWPLDENGKEMCFDSYGFSMPSDSKTGDDMSYWTADVEISKCNDRYADGRHQCTYDVAGYGFSVKNNSREFSLLKFETMLELANLRCLKNRSKK
jgi:uncharacterized protein (TIGR02145 family)